MILSSFCLRHCFVFVVFVFLEPRRCVLCQHKEIIFLSFSLSLPPSHHTLTHSVCFSFLWFIPKQQQMGDGETCSHDWADIEGFRECLRCGLVDSQVFSDEREWVTFSFEEEEKSSRVQVNDSLYGHATAISATTTQIHKRSTVQLMKLHNTVIDSTVRQTFRSDEPSTACVGSSQTEEGNVRLEESPEPQRVAMRRMSQLKVALDRLSIACAQIQLPSTVHGVARKIFDDLDMLFFHKRRLMLQSIGSDEEKIVENMLAPQWFFESEDEDIVAVIFMACRQSCVPWTLRELCSRMNVQCNAAQKAYTALVKLLGAPPCDGDRVESLLPKMCEQLLGPEDQISVLKDARLIIGISSDLLSGRPPANIAAATLFFTYTRTSLCIGSLSLAQAAKRMGVSSSSMLMALKILDGHSQQLLEQLPHPPPQKRAHHSLQTLTFE